jgi:GTP-binding protein
MFIDKARIKVVGGSGGNGIVAFRREKYVPHGGPAGGRGGNGGSVILEVDKGLRTLIDLQYNKVYKAERGTHGEGSNKNGKNGEDIIINVPPGTSVYDNDTGNLLADLVVPGQRFIAAEGGKGGRGNTSFVTSVRRAPSVAENGMPGDERNLRLELKLLADVGLVGYPNVGKSTLLSVVSAAKPKIADYHFTTLKPSLGTVYLDVGESFVIADLPGLIEGAAQGQGLGHEFLRHIERTKVIIHVIDVSGYEGRDPIEDFHDINKELFDYRERLKDLPQLIALNKFDLINEKELVQDVIDYFEDLGFKVFLISAATGYGTTELMRQAYVLLEEVWANEPETKDIEMVIVPPPIDDGTFEITKEDGIFVVSGPIPKKLAIITDFSSKESLYRFQGLLKKHGIIKELKKMGVQEGDTIRFDDLMFEYYPDSE